MKAYPVRWNKHLPPEVKEIIETLNKRGRKAYVVGGAVRDLWLGRTPKDFDLASDASVDEIASLFPKTIALGKAFGIMVVVLGEYKIEVARFRTDGAYTDNRHPDQVTFADPAEDAARRDFTMNALFYDSVNDSVIDYVGGVEDLEGKVIRTVGEADTRFQEDALRPLRAVRFFSQLTDFRLDQAILTAAPHYAPSINKISRERVSHELLQTLRGSRALQGLQYFETLQLWPQIFGKNAPTSDLLPKLEKRLKKFTKEYPKEQNPEIALLSFLQANHALNADHLILPKEFKNRISSAAKMEHKILDFDSVGLAEKKEVLLEKEFPLAWATFFTEDLEDLPALAREWTSLGRLNYTPLVKASDLLTLGVAPGPTLGIILSKIRKLQLEEKISTKEQALSFAKTSMNQNTKEARR